MKSAAYLLALGEAGWQIARIAGGQVELRKAATDRPTEPAGIKQAAAALGELDYDGEDVCLALPSDWVLIAEIDCANLPRKQRRVAMIYRLEEQLPLDAERLTADFLPPLTGRSLGMAVETQSVQQLIDRLTEAGVQTRCVCAAALLAAWEFCQVENDPSDYLILSWNSTVDVFRIVQRHPVAWYRLPPEAAELVRCVQADVLVNLTESDRPGAAVVGRLDPAISAALENEAGLQLNVRRDERPIIAAARTAGEILTGRKAGWIDFRTDALAPPDPWGQVGGLLRWAVCLAILLLFAVAGSLYWRGTRYDTIARRYQTAQAANFEELYPNKQIPPSPRRYLRSELKRLSALSRPAGVMPNRPCSLESLRRIVTNLPAAIRLRIVDVRIGPGGILLEGQARDHSAAEIVAQGLRRSGFQVDPPRSEHLVRGGVAFTITAAHGKTEQLARAPGGAK